MFFSKASIQQHCSFIVLVEFRSGKNLNAPRGQSIKGCYGQNHTVVDNRIPADHDRKASQYEEWNERHHCKLVLWNVILWKIDKLTFFFAFTFIFCRIVPCVLSQHSYFILIKQKRDLSLGNIELRYLIMKGWHLSTSLQIFMTKNLWILSCKIFNHPKKVPFKIFNNHFSTPLGYPQR